MNDDVRAVLARHRPYGVMIGDSTESLTKLPDKCIQTCATSPPYYNLRDYGTAKWEGGDPNCSHRPPRLKTDRNEDRQKLGDGYATHGSQLKAMGKRKACDKCGSIRIDLQIGLEESPQKYIERLLTVFREVHRVLRDDGTLWINIGDSYANDAKGPNGNPGPRLEGAANQDSVKKVWRGSGLKKKDRVGIPHMLAFALRDDGWYWRDEVIWFKPNPMPMSVRDRTTPAHEFVFLFTKKPRYFFDSLAVAEPAKTSGKKIKMADGWDTGPGGHGAFHRDGREKGESKGDVQGEARNRRSVWRISTKGYKGSHYATYPPDLVLPCILAGTSEAGCCTECGTPWRRMVKRNRKATRPGTDSKVAEVGDNKQDQVGNRTYTGFNARWKESQVVGNRDPLRHVTSVETLGWRPGCGCGGGLSPEDLEVIETPTGKKSGDDPSIVVGRAGFNRPRGDSEGRRAMTRYEQREYAKQIKNSAHKAQMAEESGAPFTHYVRTDRSGARPVPADLLDRWIEAGWLTRVEVPDVPPLTPVPCLVLDPFVGSGTTLEVAVRHGRRAIGLDLDERNLLLIQERMAALQPTLIPGEFAAEKPARPSRREGSAKPSGLLSMLD